MLYVTALVVFLFSLLAFILDKNDFLSPAFIVLITTFFSVCVGIVGNRNWKINCDQLMILAIYFAGSLSLIIGDQLAKNKRIKIKKNLVLSDIIVDVPKKYIFIFLVFIVIVSTLVCRRYNAIAIERGYTGEFWQSKARIIKEALSYRGYHLGIGLATLYSISTVITYIFIFLFIYNQSLLGLNKTFKKYWIYLLFIIPWAYVQNYHGQRSEYIGMISFAVYDYFLLKTAATHKKIRPWRIFRTLLIAFFAFLFIFSATGIKSGRLVGGVNENVLVYVGSAIVDMCAYLQENHPFSLGAVSFSGARATLSRFGINFSSKSYFHFIMLNNGSVSNVFGSFGTYYADFTLFGLCYVCFLIGMIYRIFYNTAKNGKSCLAIFYYGYFSYGIVMAAIADQQLSLFLSVGQIMFVFFSYIILPLFLKHWYKLLKL